MGTVGLDITHDTPPETMQPSVTPVTLALAAVTLTLTLGVTLGYDPADPYLSLDVDQLYRLAQPAVQDEEGLPEDIAAKMAAMYRMSLLEDAWAAEPEAEARDQPYWAPLPEDSATYNDRLYSGPQPRDPETLQHSTLTGYQSVTGGAGEVPANPKEVKSDKALPEYCNPPNPCPIGKTAADNCVENFENSATHNQELLKAQTCPCDTEHMFSCPAGQDTVSSKGRAAGEEGEEQMALNKVLDDLAKMDSEPSQQKRVKLVAKKSPHIIHKRATGEHSHHGNPYLAGAPINVAAKKSPQLSGRGYGNH